MKTINEHRFKDENIGDICVYDNGLVEICNVYGDFLIELTKEDRQVIGESARLAEENEVLKARIKLLERIININAMGA